MEENTTGKKLHYTLRLAAAMCFIGHGAFGIITKQIWFNYFGVFGIPHDTALTLMPVVGLIDILMGISLLIYPTRAILLWLVFWGLMTAALRPLSGEPFAEFLERAGNYGAPLVLLFIHHKNNKKFPDWFKRITPDVSLDERDRRTAMVLLQVIVFLLLAGHGWLNIMEKKGLLSQYATLGFSSPEMAARFVGIFEICTATLILIKPYHSLVLLLFIWKMGSELFYPQMEIFEWIERGGSYGALLALWFILYNRLQQVRGTERKDSSPASVHGRGKLHLN